MDWWIDGLLNVGVMESWVVDGGCLFLGRSRAMAIFVGAVVGFGLVSGHLPAAAERAVKLNDGDQLAHLRLHLRTLGRVELLLRLEDLVITGLAVQVALRGHLDGGSQGRNGLSVVDQCFGKFLAGDQDVGHFVEGVNHGLFVGGFRLVKSSFRGAVLSAKLSALEQRAGEGGADVPRGGGAGTERRKFGADLAEEGGEPDSREEIREVGADEGIGGDERLFGAHDIGPALQERGRQTGRARR